MTIYEALSWATGELTANGVEGPRSSPRLLLQQVIKHDLAYLFTNPGIGLTIEEEEKFRDWVGRRVKHEPVWYIADNQIKFFGNTFYVDKNVLIPRPETELLVENIINRVKDNSGNIKKILDIGTGSGSIILSLASILRENNDVTYFASDISSDALEVARRNSKNFGLEGVVSFAQGNLFEPWNNECFDLIVTNLPYIPHEDLPYLDKDVVQYEPLSALDGGKGGLEIYREFFDTASLHLNPGAVIYCEIGHNQGAKIIEMATKALLGSKETLIKDYANLDRIVIIETVA